MQIRNKLATALLCAFGLSCSGGSDLRLLSDSPPDDWSERRRMMNVRIVDPVDGAKEELPDQFATLLQQSCVLGIEEVNLDCASTFTEFTAASGTPTDSGGFVASNCRKAACVAELRLCVAHALLEISSTASQTDVNGTLVPPQSRETRAALAEVAVRVAQLAATDAGEAIRTESAILGTCDGSAGNQFDDPYLGNGPVDTPRTGESLAASLVEAVDLVREATEHAVDDNLAAADAALSSTASALRARREAYIAPILSRGHAADVVVGGATADVVFSGDGDSVPNAVPLLDNNVLCTSDSSDPGVEAAKATIREAAVRPEDLQDQSISIDDFVAGTLGSGMTHNEEGSIRERIEDLYDVELGDSIDEVYATLGLQRRHFLRARKEMNEEMRAFSRDRTRTSTPRVR